LGSSPTIARGDAHAALHDLYTEARERHRFTHDDAARALAAAGVPVENLRRELVKPTAQWTSAHAAALSAWLDTLDATGWVAPSEPSPAKAPTRTRARAVATPENEALRVRYRAALTAKLLTGEATAKRVGCSEGTLRQWKDGALQNLGSDRDPEGKWLAALTAILDGLDANASTP
jgi:trans-aconitate methyltransferase